VIAMFLTHLAPTVFQKRSSDHERLVLHAAIGLRVTYRVYTIQQMYSKYTWIAGRLLEVCWTFAGSCKHPIRLNANSTAVPQ